MIIYGWGRRRSKVMGQSKELTCLTCSRVNRFNLVESKKWFTLFFIPVIPYDTQRGAVCPNCSNGYVLTKEDFVHAMETGIIRPLDAQHDQVMAQQGL